MRKTPATSYCNPGATLTLVASNCIASLGVACERHTARKGFGVYRSFMPDCRDFDVKNLTTAFEKLGDSVIDLKLVPFGNAVINKTAKTVECQHGLGECDANSYEQCLIAAYPDPNDHLPVMSCLFQELPMGHHDTKISSYIFETCTVTNNLQFENIKFCHDNFTASWELTEEAASETPYHDHVPWIEIEGAFMDDEQIDFFTEICNVYSDRGGYHPACFSTPGFTA